MPCTDNLVDPQHGSKVHVSNRRVLRISCGTYFGRLLSVRARICHPLQHGSRSATALAKRLSGPHARPGELRDGAIESPDQYGDACVLCLEQKVAHRKWHGQNPLDLTMCPTANLVEFPLTAPQLIRRFNRTKAANTHKQLLASPPRRACNNCWPSSFMFNLHFGRTACGRRARTLISK